VKVDATIRSTRRICGGCSAGGHRLVAHNLDDYRTAAALTGLHLEDPIDPAHLAPTEPPLS